MAVTFSIPTPLRAHAGGLAEVALPGDYATVRAALTALWKQHPGLKDRIVDETGAVRRHLNLFVGDESIKFLKGLESAVPEGACISVIPAVSGG